MFVNIKIVISILFSNFEELFHSSEKKKSWREAEEAMLISEHHLY